MTDSRDWSPDRSESRVVRHQHSFSESGRASVPMWDSSDPDRAPPPLPLNPGAVNNSPLTKPNVSSNIEKAAALIASRALDSTPSSYTSNPPPNASPERNLMKSHHKRMQSMQTGSVGRLSDSLERRSPDKGLSRAKRPELDEYRANRSYERSPVRTTSSTPTPVKNEDPFSPIKNLNDENTPPTAGMIALQSVRNRQDAESPLKDITSSASENKSDMSLDSLSNQILHITSIATNLQREMSNLSRRSKDNATDLTSLREATNSRDEDIRKSLKELVTSLDTKFTSIDSRILGSSEASRSTPNLAIYTDDPHLTPTRKTINFPRVASPSIFDRDITASPSVVSVDGAASIALLEKVLREMGTRDGQDKIMTTLENVKAYADKKSSQATSHNSKSVIDPDMMKKLEEILMFMKDMKEDSGSKALIKSTSLDLGRSPSQIDMYLEKNGQVAKVYHDNERRSSGMGGSGSELLTDDVLKTLKSVKQSLSHSGGLTNEVKTLIRELRGEVLGMGREIARKLESAQANARDNTENDSPSVTPAEVSNIVEQGLAELKEHMHYLVQENRRETGGSQQPSVDTNTIVRTIEDAFASFASAAAQSRSSATDRDEMMVAIKEAWEDCKPEIALEHFGLERDEILETLKEGLQSYQNETQRSLDSNGITYDEVLEAVRNGLRDFQPPTISNNAAITREEILETIKDCFDNHSFSGTAAPSQLTSSELGRDEIVDAVREVLAVQALQPTGNSFTKDEMLQALQEGLSAHSHVTKEVDFNRDDLFDAIKACLEGEQNPLGGMGERVVEAMHEFLGSMKTEFQQYSAANGRDTEQVLDALKDGLEELRADVESYVDRAADVTGKDEIIDTVKAGFAAMQVDMEKGFSNRMQNSNSTTEVLDAMDKEFEHLRETINKSLARANVSSDREEILEAIREISDENHSALGTDSKDIVRHVKEELEHMRNTLASNLVRGGSSLEREDVLDAIREGLETSRALPRADGGESVLSNTSELLDAFQEGVDGIRAELRNLTTKSADLSTNFEILDTLKEGIENVRTDIGRLQEKHFESSDQSTSRGQEMMLHEGSNIASEIEGLKVMITQLRIKVEALDNMAVPETIIPSEMHMHRDELDDLHSAIRGVRDSVNNLPRQATVSEAKMPTGVAMKDDTDAIETLLRNVKARLDDLVMPDTETIAKTSQLLSIEDMLREVKSSVDETSRNDREQSNKEDFTIIELLLKDVQASIEGIQTGTGGRNEENFLSKTDLEVLESICLETKEKLESLPIPSMESLGNKEDLGDIKDTIQALREQFEADNDLTAQAFEARKIEHGGLATKIDDVKTLMADVREELVGKLNGSEEGIVELAKVLGMHHDNMTTYATAASVAELSSLITHGFDSHMEHLTNGKSEMEERDATLFDKHEQTSSSLKSQIEERFNEIMIKYDDAQLANEAKLSSIDERDKSHLEATAGVKSVVDDLKSLMDTLGSTVSEACEKMTADARTVYEKVDDANTKLGDLHAANAYEHGMTRDELAKILVTAGRMEGTLENHQPAILAAVREVLGIVGQHYEHSQQHSETFRTTAEEIKSGVSAIPSAIPPLLPAPEATRSMSFSTDLPDRKDYDDSAVRSKLDELLLHATNAQQAFSSLENHHTSTHESLGSLDQLSHLDKLDGLDKLQEIQEQVRNTANEVSMMVATQTRLMAEEHDAKTVEAREAAIALEKRTAQKEIVEAEIIALTQEKTRLADSMAVLRAEHEQLADQTKQLSREVGKLEMALSIRQDEMRDMNARAESLERRVLEGVMNHARSMKFAKPLPKKISAAERDASMNLKRVPSTNSNATAKASSPRGKGSALGSAVSMALKKRQPLGAAANPVASPRASVDRRILSTSHVTGSRLSETPRALVLAPSPTSSLANLKRSHSVKSNPSSYLSGRKASWNGTESFVSDKENHAMQDGDIGDDGSDAGTERRTSFTGTYADSLGYQTGSTVSRNSLRSTSYASSVGGTLNGQQDSILEEDEADDKETAEDEEQMEDPIDGDVKEDESEVGDEEGALILAGAIVEPANFGLDTHIVSLEAEDELGELPDQHQFQRHEPKYSIPSDSGIGSEPPTPDVSNQGSQAWRSTLSS